MFNRKFNKFIALFMSLVFSFNLLPMDVFSGYAADDPQAIAHNQNLEESYNEGKEESLLQGNGSQLPSTVFVGRTDPISLGNNGQNPYLLKSDNNWWLLCNYDHLSYNTLHIMVQDVITDQNPGVKKELYFKYNQPDSNYPKGKETGSADLFEEVKVDYSVNTDVYLWEVKPKSYLDINKAKGEKQLDEYINRNKLQVGHVTDVNVINSMTFVQGETNGVTIDDGDFYFYLYIISPTCSDEEVEKVRYDVHYEVQKNGLVIYTFRRTSCGKKPRRQEQEQEQEQEQGQDEKDKDKDKDKDNDKGGQSSGQPSPVYAWDDRQIVVIATGGVVLSLEGLNTITKYASLVKATSGSLGNRNIAGNGIVSPYKSMEKAAGIFLAAVLAGNAMDTTVNAQSLSADSVISAVYKFKDTVNFYGEHYPDAFGVTKTDRTNCESEWWDPKCWLSCECGRDPSDPNQKTGDGADDIFCAAGDAAAPRDPLVIDLNSIGILLTSVDNGVYFDLDNNGFAEKTAWVDPEDGFLVLDRNGNGTIDNGGELFGDQVQLENGSKSSSGFEALAELDSNGDGFIDSDDASFADLNVWVDKNQNGISEPNELFSLIELEISSISLDYREVGGVDDATGTIVSLESEVAFGDGTARIISEHWFKVNSRDSQDLHDYGEGVVVTSVESFGNIMSLNNAIKSDKTGGLGNIVDEFKASIDYAEKRVLIKRILYFITNASDIAPDSRGGNIDARDLHVIEQFMGRGFIGIDGGTSPNVNAAKLLKSAYSMIENMYFNQLNKETLCGCYLNFIFEDRITDNDGEVVKRNLDLSWVSDMEFTDNEIAYGKNVISGIASWLLQYDSAFGTDAFDNFKAGYAEYADVFNIVKNANVMICSSNNKTFWGTSAPDLMWSSVDGISLAGQAGNDILYGGNGSDILDGGTGNDILYGGAGNDTYVFAKGYGSDTIIDSDGLNTLRFKGLNPLDILVNGTGDYDATITIKGTNDTLVIKDFRKGEEYANYDLEFDGVKMHVTDQGSPFRHIYGGNGDDVLKAVVDDSIMHAFGGIDTVYGSDGNDIIYGNEGDDVLYAGSGNDLVYGGDGDDILDGGEGDDFLYGGSGNDTYVFGRNYGTDIISDSEGVSTIKIADGISLDELDIISIGENIVISLSDSEDKIIINGFAENPDNYILEVGGESTSLKDRVSAVNDEFLSGSDESDYIVNESSSIVAGGSGDDRIIGNAKDEIIFGDSGNDQILSDSGNDVIFGGSVDDYINGGDGNDMIDGGSGNDFIDGGTGDDIYFFNPGYGNDSIKDSDGANTIVFGDGFTASGIKTYRSNWNDLLITFDGFEDTLTIKDYCINENAKNFTLMFADGTVVEAAAKDSPLRKIYGTDGSEYMESIYDDGIINDAQASDDQIVGSDGNDTLYGSNGDERITGKAGDDVLDGGNGNDYLSGGAGNDTYIFNKGYGVDTISDGEGTNTININGYSANQIKAYRTNWNDITITFADSEDKIIIEGFFTSEANRNFYLTFNGGGRIHATASNSPLRTIYGTDGDDYMSAMDGRGVTLYGEDGSDNINGGSGYDRLYGGNGNDQLYGNGGNDILDGGEGNDMLYGGAGNDTYIFNVGSGTDTIIDSEGINTILFGAGLTEDAMTAYRYNWNDLMITFEGVEDKLIIQGYFGSESNRNFEVRFADGTRYAYDDAENPIKQVHATEYDDWMTAWSDNGIALHGDGGNDNLTGGAGDDMLFGGVGNDTLNGNDGDDILDGGEGSDFLYGGLGNDTYRFGIGYGSDIIEDNDGDNKVEILGVNSDAVSFEMTDSGELVVTITDSGDVLMIRNFDSERFAFEFADEVSGTFNIETGEFERILSEEELAAIDASNNSDESTVSNLLTETDDIDEVPITDNSNITGVVNTQSTSDIQEVADQLNKAS